MKLKEWKLIYEAGQAPKTFLFKCGNYKLSYHISWNVRNQPTLWYIKVFYNKNEIAEFDSVEKLEEFLKQRELPSAKGLPYIFGGE
jgi:hypothetical protein